MTQNLSSPSYLDHFQNLLDQDPTSRAFAPLAEVYRKQGQHEKALDIALKGVAQNPNFPSGKVALAQILIDLEKHTEAQDLLKEVLHQDHENILAYKLLGKSYVLTKEHPLALKAFKKALLVQPLDTLAQKMVLKLESLSARGFDSLLTEEVEENLPSQESKLLRHRNRSLHGALSYVDALLAQSKHQQALAYINEAFERFPKNGELKKRQLYIEGLKGTSFKITKEQAVSKPHITQEKIKVLQKALYQIELKQKK